MQLTEKQSKHNFFAFLWHTAFLALASSFMDVDTIIPSMLIKAGGNSIHLGILTAIMLGGSMLFQLIFASYLSNKNYKRGSLLLAINLRVLSLLSLAILFYKSTTMGGDLIIFLIFVLISIFSFSGSFANVSYVDILGKSVLQRLRKKFFTSQQIVSSTGILISALVVRKLIKQLDYPFNYSVLFLIAGILLFIATAGFWNIKEPESKVEKKSSLWQFFAMIPSEIRKNKNLKYYLLIINSMGLGLSILPFLILFAKENFGLSFEMIGNFLLFRTSGMLIAGLVLFKFSERLQYKFLLRICLVLGSVIPLISLAFSDHMFLYQFIFILSGIFVATYKVSINGVLLEISNNDNRAVYAGISGAGNILTAIFPLFAGVLISAFGFHFVFIFVVLLILSSYIFTTRINCQHSAE